MTFHVILRSGATFTVEARGADIEFNTANTAFQKIAFDKPEGGVAFIVSEVAAVLRVDETPTELKFSR